MSKQSYYCTDKPGCLAPEAERVGGSVDVAKCATHPQRGGGGAGAV